MKRVFIPLTGGWFTKKPSRARRCLLAIPLTFFCLAAAGQYAYAANPNSVCMPQPYSVPGLPGPPDWLTNNKWNGLNNNDWINDPRWTGALAFGYVNGTAYDVNFRAVSSGTPPTLYLSWNVRVDPLNNNPLNPSNLYVGFFPEAATGAPTGTGYVIQVALNATTTCSGTCPADSSTPGTPFYAPPQAQTPPPNRNFDVVLFQESMANNWADVTATTPWFDSVVSNMRISKLPSNPYTWNVEMKIPIDSTNAIGPNLLPGTNTKFLFWHDVELATPGGIVDDYHWPRPTSLCGSPPYPCYAYNTNVAVNVAPPDPFSTPTQWGEIQLRQLNPACPAANVVSLDSYLQVGTHNPPTATDPNPPDNEFRANGVNVFFAKPTNSVNASIPAGDLNVTFRIADWGSTFDPNAPWTVLQGLKNVPTQQNIAALSSIDLEPPQAMTTFDLTNPSSGSQQCQLRCDFLGTAGTVGSCNCSGSAKKTADQCILVTLAGNVDFSSDSVKRNMNVATASNFERDAQIDVAGMSPLSTPTRDVYIFVEKQQMPGFPTIINGTPRPPAPVAVNETASTTMGEPVTIDLSAGASGNPASAALVGTPAEGAVTGFPATTVTFTPATEFTGTATFQFTLANANGTSNTATATITVTSPNESPVPTPERKLIPNQAEFPPAPPIPNQAEVPPAPPAEVPPGPTTSLDPSVQLTKMLPAFVVHVLPDTGLRGPV